MAAITIFTLILLTFSTTTTIIHGRESQFFAKVSNNINPQDSQPLINTNQQDSKTADNSYGLFGHESGQLPPSTTTTTTNNHLPANLPENYNPVAYTTPIHSNTQNLPEEFDEPQAFQYNGDNQNENENQNQYQYQNQFMGNGDNDVYNFEKQEVGTNGGKMYNSQKQGMSDTRFLENGKYYYGGDNGYNSRKQGAMDGAMFVETSEDGGKMYNSQKQESGRYNQGQEMYNSQKQENGRYNQGQEMYNSQKQGNNGNMYNTQKQGMSDTRFLESGKYYYDLNSENLNANGNMNSRGFEYNNNKGYYGNNDVNSYERYNSNGGYQNQDEFQENQDDQFNP